MPIGCMTRISESTVHAAAHASSFGTEATKGFVCPQHECGEQHQLAPIQTCTSYPTRQKYLIRPWHLSASMHPPLLGGSFIYLIALLAPCTVLEDRS